MPMKSRALGRPKFVGNMTTKKAYDHLIHKATTGNNSQQPSTTHSVLLQRL